MIFSTDKRGHGPFVQVACGDLVAYALKEDSSIQAWGRDGGYYEESVGQTEVSDLPIEFGWSALGVNVGYGFGFASVYDCDGH